MTIPKQATAAAIREGCTCGKRMTSTDCPLHTETQSAFLHMRCREFEKIAWQKKAKSNGLSLSQWIKLKLNKEAGVY